MYNNNSIKFEEYVKDEILNFYGVCGNEFKIGDYVFEAIEDPDDGYRSCLDCVMLIEPKGNFFGTPIAAVKVDFIKDENFNGYEITDIFTNHVWLAVGTETYDSWYPGFVFKYNPDKSQTI